MAKIPWKTVKKNSVNPSSLWKGYVFSSTGSIFTKDGNLDGEFFNVGEPSLWGLTIPSAENWICNGYGKCTIPWYEYLFSSLWVNLPFTAFEVDVLNYLMVAPSQLHPTSWAYVKAFQYWCEYLNGKPYVVLFFHLCHCNWSTLVWPRERKLLLMVPIRVFYFFPKPPSFADQLFFLAPSSSGSCEFLQDWDECGR